MEAGFGAMGLQVEKYQGLQQPKMLRRDRKNPLLQILQRHCQHLDFLTSRTVGEYISVVLSHLVHGSLIGKL
jgi:hypothetical protein